MAIKIKMKAVDLTDLMAQAQNTGRELGRAQADKAAVYEKMYSAQDKATLLEAKVSSRSYQVDEYKAENESILLDLASSRDVSTSLRCELHDSKVLVTNLRAATSALKNKAEVNHPFTESREQECSKIITGILSDDLIKAIKAVRALTGLGLKEAKELVLNAQEAGLKLNEARKAAAPFTGTIGTGYAKG